MAPSDDLNLTDSDPPLGPEGTRFSDDIAYSDNPATFVMASIKGPCVVATTANISLVGTPTIDGVTVAVGDRVLVKDQTTASENGVYSVAAGSWTRALDFDDNTDVVTGTKVFVTGGTVNGLRNFYVSTTGSIVPGTSSIAFTDETAGDFLLLRATQAQAEAGTSNTTIMTPLRDRQALMARDVIQASDYGVSASNSDNATAWAAVYAVAVARGAADIILPPGVLQTSATLSITRSNIRVLGRGGSLLDGSTAGTTIKWIGSAGGIMAEIKTSTGAVPTVGAGFEGISFNGMGVAGTGLYVGTCGYPRLRDLHCYDVTSDCYYFKPADAADVNGGASYIRGLSATNISWRVIDSAAVQSAYGMRFIKSTDGTSNTNFGFVANATGQSYNAAGILSGPSGMDNMEFRQCTPATFGTGYSFDLSSGTNHFYGCSWGATRGVIIRGNVVSVDNAFYEIDTGNGATIPENPDGAGFHAMFSDGRQVWGGATGSVVSPSPRLNMGAYYSSTVIPSHVLLYGGGTGIGVSAGYVNWLSDFGQAWYVNGSTTPAATMSTAGVLDFKPGLMSARDPDSRGQPVGYNGQWENIQTEVTLTNPFTTTNTSTTVKVTWAAHGFDATYTYVKFTGASAVGGLTLSGWYEVASIVDANNFNIVAGSAASSTATGGGTVTARPSYNTLGSAEVYVGYSGAPGFDAGRSRIAIWEPEFYPNTGQIPMQGIWQNAISPNDTAHGWSMTASEVNVTNRGSDRGWYLSLYGAANAVTGYNFVPETSTLGYAGEGKNAYCAVNVGRSGSVNSTGRYVSWYKAFDATPGSLVPKTHDPSNHGGVFLTAGGGYYNGATATTTNGSATVTIDTGGGVVVSTVGHFVVLRDFPTVGGLNINGTWAITALPTTTSFRFTAGGAAASSATATGTVELYDEAPHSYALGYGIWHTGIDFTLADFVTSTAFKMLPGQTVSWNDGTGQADIFGSGSGGNVNITLRPAGSGITSIYGALLFNGYGAGALKTDASGNVTAGVVSSTYGGAGTVSGILKANGSGVVSAAVAGTDYLTGSSTNTLTNKTFDTAGTGNSFSINGVAATANTGTGSVVRADTPTFTGTPAAPTAAAATNTTQIATTAFVETAIGGSGAWTAFTPAVTMTGGSGWLTTVATGAYRQVGKFVVCRMRIAGTYSVAGTSLNVGLPVGVLSGTIGNGAGYNGTTFKNVQIALGEAAGNAAVVRLYDGTFPMGASGDTLWLTGFYEAT